MGAAQFFTYVSWGIGFASLGVFGRYALKDLGATRGRVEHKLTLAGTVSAIVSFLVTALASFVVPEPRIIYAAFIIWLVGLLLLALLEALRWKSIQQVYTGSFSRTLKLYLGKKYYLISSLLFLVVALPLWLWLMLEPTSEWSSWVGLGAGAMWSASVINLANAERKFYQKTRVQEIIPTRGRMPSGGDDVITATALVDFVNSFLGKAEWIAGSPTRNVLVDYFESNPILFQDCKLSEDGTVRVEPILPNLARIPEENRMHTMYILFSLLTDKLTKLYSSMVSSEWAEKTVEDCYFSLKGKYSHTPAEFAILRIIPKGMLENERLSLLSKEELESRVRLRTSELEESKAQLQVLKEFHEQIVKRAPIGILRTDKEGRTIFANTRAAEIFGLARQSTTTDGDLDATEILGVGEAVKTSGLSAEHLMNVSRPGDVGGSAEMNSDLNFTLSNGKLVQTRVSAVALSDRDGNFDGTLVLIEDITEREQAARERRELERRAQIASRLATVGEMASGIAHEINNPLTGVIGFSQVLLRENLPDDVRRSVKIINDGAERVAAIVKRLLAFARQQKPERKMVNVNEILDATLLLRSYELKVSNITVTLDLDPALPATLADGGQLQQVFLNVIINAEKEMKAAHNKGTLQIKTEQHDGHIVISFKDDGPGIAKEHLDKIFTPFFTTRKVGEGTGLGLSVCWGIMAEHNGHIYARSEPGQGATFFVKLPVVTAGQVVTPEEPAAPAAGKQLQSRILVVDDDPDVRQLIVAVLKGDGHTVSMVDNAADGLSQIRNQDYHLIILDIKLPGTSGIELFRRLQKQSPALTNKIVFVTGDVMAADTKDFLAQTHAPYLTKPFDIKEFRAYISGFLARNKS